MNNRSIKILFMQAAVSAITICMIPLAAADSTYTVKQGDTLWDISSDKIQSPFLWPKLWKANPGLINPHLIYPGQQLTIPDEIAKQQDDSLTTTPKLKDITILKPYDLSANRVPSKDLKILVSREVLLHSGFVTDKINEVGKVYSNPLGKTVMGRNDTAYIKLNSKTLPGTQFYILSTPEPLIDPSTKKELGKIVRIKGTLQYTGEENGNSKSIIKESFEEISLYDPLINYYSVEALMATSQENRPNQSGTIVKQFADHTVSGTGYILYLNKGRSSGIAIGDLFEIVTGEKPHSPLGDVQIISVQQNTSIGIMKKALREVVTGDLFRNL
ncbi:MAG: LysM peptidoglycan-binding domain-containing protein [Nitrospirae bacterium]|nr:LysM peptidoglycan-binding domain-containing protein [Nitrospirota bacterium]